MCVRVNNIQATSTGQVGNHTNEGKYSHAHAFAMHIPNLARTNTLSPECGKEGVNLRINTDGQLGLHVRHTVHTRGRLRGTRATDSSSLQRTQTKILDDLAKDASRLTPRLHNVLCTGTLDKLPLAPSCL